MSFVIFVETKTMYSSDIITYQLASSLESELLVYSSETRMEVPSLGVKWHSNHMEFESNKTPPLDSHDHPRNVVLFDNCPLPYEVKS